MFGSVNCDIFAQFTANAINTSTQLIRPYFNGAVATVFTRLHCIYQSIDIIIIHQTHYEKSDWSRAFNQFTIACELEMINAISAPDIAFIMSSSTSAWLLSPLECSQKQNGWTLRFCFWGCIMWKMYNKTIIEFGFRMMSWIIKTSCLCYLPQPSALADNTDLGFNNSWYHAQPHNNCVFDPYR